MARRRSGRKIDFTRWTANCQSFAALSAGATAATYFSAGSRTETILRIRGNLLAYVDGVQAPGTQADIGVGIVKVPADQGTTVVLSPIADDTAPWLYYERFALGYEEAVVDAVGMPGLSVFRATIDIKAMRIMRPEEQLHIVVENVTILSALAVNVTVCSRALLGA